MIINDWRLTPGFLAFVISTETSTGSSKRVYLASRDKKTDASAVQKLIPETPYTEITSDLNELEFKFERLEKEWTPNSVGAFIRSPEIFSDDSWYRVMNFYEPHMVDILIDLCPNKGTFEGLTFEAIFSESTPGVVSFVCPGMPGYMTYFEEMKRRINCETNKKTKKWIPGHRYDTLKETYYYLGTFASRKDSANNSEFKETLEMANAYLYVNHLRDTDRSITDIFKTRTFGTGPDNILVSYTLPSAVESGEALINDFEGGDIRDYWNVMIDNAVEDCKVKKSENYTGFDNTYKIFDVLCYFSNWSKLDYPSEIKEKIAGIIDKLAYDALVEWCGIQRSDNNLTIDPSSKSEKDNVKALERNIYALTRDTNISKNAYYPVLFKKLGINLDSILTESLKDWDPSDFSGNFSTYCQYGFYFDKRNSDINLISRQRVNTSSYSIDLVPIKSILGEGTLTRTVIDMINFAKQNCGIGVSKYAVYNVGTKKSPKEYISCEVTLKDLLDHTKDSISDELKSEIIKHKFTRIIVQADKDRELE